MTDIIPHIREGALITDIPPPLGGVLLVAVQTQRAGQEHGEAVAVLHGVQLDVDVEGERGLRVGGDGGDACDAVVFRLVVVGHCEVVFEERGIA